MCRAISVYGITIRLRSKSQGGFVNAGYRIVIMYCPKCGDPSEETKGTFTCVRGEMELSKDMATRLYACFVSPPEQPEEFEFTKAQNRWGGRWFCPACAVLMHEETPGAVRCPKCGRNIRKLIYALVRSHPHRGGSGEPPWI
jgi:hypothetical protein